MADGGVELTVGVREKDSDRGRLRLRLRVGVAEKEGDGLKEPLGFGEAVRDPVQDCVETDRELVPDEEMLGVSEGLGR